MANRLAKPALQRYLRKTRAARVGRLRLTVPPGVFHPSFFFSSKAFAEWIGTQELAGKRVLDVGCGSGVLALTCADMRALVTAVDINPAAVAATRANASRNGLQVHCLQSDLFHAVDGEPFDRVFVNPPYFQGTPVDDSTRAWRAGPHWEYFQGFFQYLQAHLGAALGQVHMILADNCDIEAISAVAAENGLHMHLEHERMALWEKQLIYEVRRQQ